MRTLYQQNGISEGALSYKHTEQYKFSFREREKPQLVHTSFAKYDDPMVPLKRLSVQLRAWTCWHTVASQWSWYDHLDSDLSLIRRRSWVTECIQMSLVAQRDNSRVKPFRCCQR